MLRHRSPSRHRWTTTAKIPPRATNPSTNPSSSHHDNEVASGSTPLRRRTFRGRHSIGDEIIHIEIVVESILMFIEFETSERDVFHARNSFVFAVSPTNGSARNDQRSHPRSRTHRHHRITESQEDATLANYEHVTRCGQRPFRKRRPRRARFSAIKASEPESPSTSTIIFLHRTRRRHRSVKRIPKEPRRRWVHLAKSLSPTPNY